MPLPLMCFQCRSSSTSAISNIALDNNMNVTNLIGLSCQLVYESHSILKRRFISRNFEVYLQRILFSRLIMLFNDVKTRDIVFVHIGLFEREQEKGRDSKLKHCSCDSRCNIR
jgi:hypothetical protein